MNPIKLVDRLILIDLIPKLLMSIAAASSLFLVAGPFIAATRFQAAGFPLWVILQFFGWDFAAFVRFTFPIGMLLAALMGFDRLSRDSEIIALFAGGISWSRVILPVVGLGLAVSLLNYVFNDQVASYALARVAEFNSSRQDIVGETTRPFDLANRNKDGVLQVNVHIERGYDVQAKELRQVTITVYDAKGRLSQVFYADRAKPLGSGLKSWILLNGTFANINPQSPAFTPFTSLETNVINKTPENMTFLQRDPDTLNFHDLRRQINEMKSGNSDSKDVLNAEVGLWFKVSLPFSCLIFGLVGAPLGMRPPRSTKVSGYVWALPIMMGYYVVYTSMNNLAIGGAVPPLLAAWLPNILGLCVGAGLIWKASK